MRSIFAILLASLFFTVSCSSADDSKNSDPQQVILLDMTILDSEQNYRWDEQKQRYVFANGQLKMRLKMDNVTTGQSQTIPETAVATDGSQFIGKQEMELRIGRDGNTATYLYQDVDTLEPRSGIRSQYQFALELAANPDQILLFDQGHAVGFQPNQNGLRQQADFLPKLMRETLRRDMPEMASAQLTFRQLELDGYQITASKEYLQIRQSHFRMVVEFRAKRK